MADCWIRNIREKHDKIMINNEQAREECDKLILYCLTRRQNLILARILYCQRRLANIVLELIVLG